MKLNINTIVVIGMLGVLSITGCTSTASFFRNRDFDYAREAVYQNKPLEVPNSVSSNPNITPALVLPSGNSHFPASTQKQAEQALQPPGLHRVYNLGYIEQQQMLKVHTKLGVDNAQASLLIYEPVKLSWYLLATLLHNHADITLNDSDVQKRQFTIKDNHTQQEYYIVLTAIKNQPHQSKLALFDLTQKPITKKDGDLLIKRIDEALNGKTVTQEMLIASGYGFIESDEGFKYQLIFSDKTATLVFIGDRNNIEHALKTAIDKAQFKYLGYNKKDSTIHIKSPESDEYLLYLYEYTELGGIFSDLTNWRHFFKAEQHDLRVAVFSMDKVLLSKEQAEPILMAIGQHLPLKS